MSARVFGPGVPLRKAVSVALFFVPASILAGGVAALGSAGEAPRIVAAFGSGIATEGESRVLGVSAEGSQPLNFRWFKDGQELAEATGASLDFSGLAPSDTANYKVEVSNAHGEVSGPLIPLLVFSSSLAAGQLDESLAGHVDGTVHALAEEEDGAVLVAGDFQHYRGLPQKYLFRLNANDEVDPDFNPGVHLPGPVTAVALQPGGRIVVAGPEWILRIDSKGDLDPAFFDGGMRTNLEITSLAIQSCGGILVAGNFTHFDGGYTGPLVRLWPDGLFREALGRCVNEDPGRSCNVEQLIVQPDGGFLVLTRIAFGSLPTRFVDRHLPDGQIDESFSYTPVSPFGPNGILPEVLAGELTGYWLLDADDISIQRLTIDGQRDPSFQALALRGSVNGFARGRDGRFFIDADLWEIGEKGPFRIESDGRFDTSFRGVENFEGLWTRAMLEHSSGDLWMAGDFSHGPNPLRLKGGGPGGGYAAWAQAHGLGAPAGDFGNRGIPNLLRFALGMDPHDPERELLPGIVVEEGEHEGSPAQFLALTYRRRVEPDELRFFVQGSHDLTDWENLTHQTGNEVDPSDPSFRRITIRDDLPINESRRFLRLSVEIGDD